VRSWALCENAGKRERGHMTRRDYTARLAIHEAAHAAANFLLGLKIYSIDIGETEGIVRHARSRDTYAWCLAKLAPRAYEEAFGYAPSGDTWDEDQVMARLRREISPGSVPQARAVLGEAADKLVCTARFDALVRSLSPIVKRDKHLTGERAEEILLEAALAQHSLMAEPSAQRYGPRDACAYRRPADRSLVRGQGSGWTVASPRREPCRGQGGASPCAGFYAGRKRVGW
jgi:hypothetical protein